MLTDATLLLEIERLATDGRGVARLPGGKVVFVAGALPGERVQAHVTSEKKDFAEAETTALVQSSPLRVEPRCPHFRKNPSCGGCDLQHVATSAQLDLKRAWLLETLRRVGRFTPAEIAMAESRLELRSGAPWEYRQRIRLHAKDGNVGFHAHGSHRLVSVYDPPCFIAHPAIRAALPVVRDAIRRCGFSGEIELTVDAKSGHVALVPFARAMVLRKGRAPRNTSQEKKLVTACREAGLLLHEAEEIHVVHPLVPHFSVHREGFVQPHREATAEYAAALEARTVAFLAECAPAGQKSILAWDLYAGSGPFSSLPVLAGKKCKLAVEVEAVEGVGPAARAIARNAVGKIRVTTGDVSEFLSRKHERLPHVVIADPPRAGLGTETTAALASCLAEATHPVLFLLVACSPAAFARDARKLVDAGFSLASLTLFDMFGQTEHYEILAEFRLRPQGGASP